MSTSISATLPADLKTATSRSADRRSVARASSATNREAEAIWSPRPDSCLRGGGLILAAATYWFVSNAGYETTDDSAIEAHVIQVSPKISAHVKAVHFDDNYQVKRGDLIS